MSSISISGSSTGWGNTQINRQQQHQQRMFAKVDSDGSGAVSASEFKTMVNDVSAKTGTSLGDSSELFSQMDGDGDGSLSSDELQQGMKSAMPPPPSTMQFAQARGATGQAGDDLFSTVDADGDGSLNADEVQTLADQMGTATGEDMGEKLAALDTDGDGSLSEAEFDAGRPSGPPSGAAQGVQGAGGPPPGAPPVGGAGSAGASDNSSDVDPLDTNQDGVVSQMERLAGELKELASSSSQDGVSSEVAQLAQKLYEQISQTEWGDSGSSANKVSLMA